MMQLVQAFNMWIALKMNEITIFLYQHPPMGGVQKPCFGAPQVPSNLGIGVDQDEWIQKPEIPPTWIIPGLVSS